MVVNIGFIERDDMTDEQAIKEITAIMNKTWHNSTHYHCKDCQSELTYWGRFNWRVGLGAAAVGACLTCRNVMIEHEHIAPQWLKMTDAK